MHNTKNIQYTAVLWIRDGVLVDRMYINPVAFAFASWLHIRPEHKNIPFLLENLINFGFAKSGVSCAQKMQMFNQEKQEIIQNIREAADDYDKIATKAAESADFFEGIIRLLKNLQNAGVLNFITSAVSQKVLDEWEGVKRQGQIISPYLTEILGARDNFTKGKDHFNHIRSQYGVNKIYYVADAVSEIRTGRQYSNTYNIIPIGFAHVITKADVMRGVELVKKAMSELYDIDAKGLNVDPNKLSLPDEVDIKTFLKDAGAEKVITKGKRGIVHSLREYFIEVNLL